MEVNVWRMERALDLTQPKVSRVKGRKPRHASASSELGARGGCYLSARFIEGPPQQLVPAYHHRRDQAAVQLHV
jgi:hypothetical protein